LLIPLKIKRFYTDDWVAYERYIESNKHEVGKRNTQKIERKNLKKEILGGACPHGFLIKNH